MTLRAVRARSHGLRKTFKEQACRNASLTQCPNGCNPFYFLFFLRIRRGTAGQWETPSLGSGSRLRAGLSVIFEQCCKQPAEVKTA